MIPSNTSGPLLSVQGMSHRFRGHDALQEVGFDLQRGEILTLIGPNGSGKSTLLKLISGLISRQPGERGGRILFTGQEMAEFDSRRLARSVVYVAPDLHLEFPLRAEEFVLMGRLSHADSDRTKVARALSLCQAGGLASRDLGTLSGGEKQLIGLARALAQESPVVLLDESLSRMDLHHQAACGALMRKLAFENGLSFILVSHDLNVASEWADRALLLERGKLIASGRIEDILNEERLQALYPDARLRVAPNPFTGKPKVFFS